MTAIHILRRNLAVWSSATMLVAIVTSGALAYVPDNRWTSTGSGSTGGDGDSITLTWSFAPDGTTIPGEDASNLISYLDGKFGAGSGGSNLTQRPWFHLFSESFDRWSQLGGITFVYEPDDSGSRLQTSSGSLGVLGDIRLGGANVDGASDTLAYTWLPNSGDIVIDTGETNFFTNSANNYRQFRNTLMHEIGHAFGLLHVESSNANLLLEPFINTIFDGPQLDDIRGIHGMYGDVFDKGLGNDTAAHATNLGALSVGGSLAIGADAATDQVIGSSETDFVSIANSGDVDFFSFTISAPAMVNLTLTPRGGSFNQGVEGGQQSTFDANARNDLSLALFASSGTTMLASANDTGAGHVEQLLNQNLTAAGTYYARVSGASTSVQLFELALSSVAPIATLPGDYNDDGVVNAADYAVWRDTRGSQTNLAADGNGNLRIDSGDYTVWKTYFGTSSGSGSISPSAVPEPPAGVILLLAAFKICAMSQRSYRHPNRQVMYEPIQ